MVRPLSERLEEISARARRAEEHVRRAREEGDEKLRARLSERKADAEARASQIEGDVSSTWSELRAKVRSQIDEIKADLDERKYERDAKHAAKRADKAEEHAAAAILFALDAIDYAESSVIDAILARAEADSYAS